MSIHAWLRALAVALSVSPGGHIDQASQAHPNALWRVVHGLCVSDARLTGQPAPCLAVDRAGGFAVVPDPGRRTQVLLVPTTRLAGIESRALLAPGSPNYWQAAWDARRFVEQRAGRRVARDEIAMAINSIDSRSQNQLHIHVDCIRPDVRKALAAHGSRIGPGWAPLTIPLAGERYRARRLSGADLGRRNPFAILAADARGARSPMAHETLVVAGATGSGSKPGFILLARGGGHAFGEELLDHQCAILQ